MLRPQHKVNTVPISPALVALLVLLSGCLPYSCRNEESTVLTPADSLSRTIAAEARADTLDLLWSVAEPLEHPRTVRFGTRAESLFVSDVERNVVFLFDTHGALLREIETVEVPYIAGVRDDTLAVFSPAELIVQFIADGQAVRQVAILDDDRPNSSLVYVALGDDIFYKRVAPDAAGFIDRLDRSGSRFERYPLEGPYWRHAGLLKTWGDTLVSLSGFRPVVDLVAPNQSHARPADERGAGASNRNHAAVDTLALRGFDSPMLARSRSFMLGDISEAPLLTSSAAASGPYLFAINIRAGWMQIDVFDRQGRLQRRLVERNPGYRKSFFPQDLDVHRENDGSYLLAVALSESPELRMYRWDVHAPSAE